MFNSKTPITFYQALYTMKALSSITITLDVGLLKRFNKSKIEKETQMFRPSIL
ncbi:hypothetical protein BD809_10677 [Aquimarina intermedia]|uniref:Uncharacterized protein n=1 Tax=Aquimarina intermedia TaxID=350814 RepID=A0A5S5C0X6_9FLAO|nr:hypothetical protein BD809_10677 [Aquimarina intermedia]